MEGQVTPDASLALLRKAEVETETEAETEVAAEVGAEEKAEAEAEAQVEEGLQAPPHSATSTPLLKLPVLAQDKYATPPSGKAGTPPLPRPNPVLTERNREVDGKRPNALQVPPKNFLRHQERYMSPTDSMVSPVSKGLLLRNKRPMRMMMAPLAPPPKERNLKRKRHGSDS